MQEPLCSKMLIFSELAVILAVFCSTVVMISSILFSTSSNKIFRTLNSYPIALPIKVLFSSILSEMYPMSGFVSNCYLRLSTSFCKAVNWSLLSWIAWVIVAAMLHAMTNVFRMFIVTEFVWVFWFSFIKCSELFLFKAFIRAILTSQIKWFAP